MRTLKDWIQILEKWAAFEKDGEHVVEWKRDVIEAWYEGARTFCKAPANIIKKDGKCELEVVGPDRPLICPEDPMTRAGDPADVFVFGRGNGGPNEYLGALSPGLIEENIETVLDALNSSIHEPLNASLEHVRHVRIEDPDETDWCADARCYLERAYSEMAKGNREHAIAAAFEAGIIKGRGDVLSDVEIEQSKAKIEPPLTGPEDKKEWTRVADKALDRHGPELTATQLLPMMGGRKSDRKLEWIFEWESAEGDARGKLVVPQSEFQAAVKRAKSLRDRRAERVKE